MLSDAGLNKYQMVLFRMVYHSQIPHILASVQSLWYVVFKKSPLLDKELSTQI